MRVSSAMLLAVTIATASVLATEVTAQTIPSPYTYVERKQEAGPYGGYLSAESGRFDLGPTGGLLLGGRYGVELSGPLALEGNLGFLSGTRDIVNPARLEGDRVIGEADVLLATLDARIRFSFVGNRAWHGISPFLTFGGGIVMDSSPAAPEEETLEPADLFEFGNSFFGTVGLGSRWFITDRFALRGDGVFSLWGIDTPPGFSDPTRGFDNVDESEWMSGLSFSIALLYRW